MDVTRAIVEAELLLPGASAPEGEADPRWQALIAVGEFCEIEPEPIWTFVRRWGSSEDEDLRAGVATCILEHMLEHHFAAIFPRVEASVRADPRFADCFSRCWAIGQSEEPEHLEHFESLKRSAAAI
jgi:hypothetical protein